MGAALLWASYANATTGLAVYVDTFAVVAADGRVNEIGPMIAGHKSECKIYVLRNYVSVVSGLTEEQNSGFDARKTLHDVLSQAASVDDAASAAAAQVRQKLPAALAAFEKSNRAAFLERSNGSLQILVVGVNDAGQVQVARRSIPYDPSKPVETATSAGAKDHVGVAVIGESGAIDRELDRLHDTNGWQGLTSPADLQKMSRRLITFEVVDKPLKVGPPLAIVLVDRDGVHWVEAGACAP